MKTKIEHLSSDEILEFDPEGWWVQSYDPQEYEVLDLRDGKLVIDTHIEDIVTLNSF